MAKQTVNVLDFRDYNLTENYFGIAKYPTCSKIGCSAQATRVVTMVKFGCTFHEQMCEEHASKFAVGVQELTSKPSSYMMGLAKFYKIDVQVLMDLPEDDRSVLQRFADMVRKDDFDGITELAKTNRPLLKKFYRPEQDEE